MGEKLVRIRPPDRNDDAPRRADPEKGRAPRLWSEFCSREFPSSTQDVWVFVIVADIFGEQTFQMAFVHRNHVIQQISSAAFDPTLRYAILPRTFEARSYRAHLQGSNGHGNLEPVLRIAVEDEKPRSQLKRKRFSQLFGRPTR